MKRAIHQEPGQNIAQAFVFMLKRFRTRRSFNARLKPGANEKPTESQRP